jgi:hypothetical protein
VSALRSIRVLRDPRSSTAAMPALSAALETAIAAYIDARNADPKPFRWTKTADDILASIERFCRRTIVVQAQCE